MLQQVVPQQQDYTQGRAVALHNVESTITELSGIFTHLATMVAHQGELAIRFSFCLRNHQIVLRLKLSLMLDALFIGLFMVCCPESVLLV